MTFSTYLSIDFQPGKRLNSTKVFFIRCNGCPMSVHEANSRGGDKVLIRYSISHVTVFFIA